MASQAKTRNIAIIAHVDHGKTTLVDELLKQDVHGIVLAPYNSPEIIDKINALYDAGITMNDVNPDYVVIGEGKSYSLETLTKATNLVLGGAKLIGTNSDVTGPIENGIAPACRALVAPIEMATGTQAYFCGKPNPLMMRTGLDLLGVLPQDESVYRCDCDGEPSAKLPESDLMKNALKGIMAEIGL